MQGVNVSVETVSGTTSGLPAMLRVLELVTGVAILNSDLYRHSVTDDEA